MAEPTKLPYSPGLEGIIAGETAICYVDPTAGLLYRGYNVEQLAVGGNFEDLAWLVLNGELPTTAQSEGLRQELAAEFVLPPPVIAMLRLLPRDAAPIDLIRTGVSMLGAFDAELNNNSHDANLRKAIRIIAKTSALMTAGWQIAQGQTPSTPGSHLTHAARLLFSLNGKEPEQWRISSLNIILALYAEHEFNASTFAARVTVSTLADMYAGVTSAMGTLKGPLHGGANEEAMKMLREIGEPANAESWLKERLANKEKIMGFGHRVYRTGDSRVPTMRELVRQLGIRAGETHWVEICEALEAAMEREKHLYANLDLYAAPALYLLGIPSALNICMFAAARVAGWCAHIIEQHDHNRIIRPRAMYVGHPPRIYGVANVPSAAVS